MHINSKIISTAALTIFSVVTQAATIPATVTKSSISTGAALQVVKQAVAQCKSDGYAVTATVVDAAGTPIAQLRDDAAGPHTVNSSYHKAFTAVSLKNPTSNYADMIEKNPKLNTLRDMDDRLLFLGGGLPIIVNDVIIGGVGVGGAPGANFDDTCAQAGLSIFDNQ